MSTEVIGIFIDHNGIGVVYREAHVCLRPRALQEPEAESTRQKSGRRPPHAHRNRGMPAVLPDRIGGRTKTLSLLLWKTTTKLVDPGLQHNDLKNMHDCKQLDCRGCSRYNWQNYHSVGVGLTVGDSLSSDGRTGS